MDLDIGRFSNNCISKSVAGSPQISRPMSTSEKDPTFFDILTRLYVNAVDEKVPKFRKRVEIARHKLHPHREKFWQQMNRVDKMFTEEPIVSRTSKIWFAISVLNIFWFGILVGSLPNWVHIFYTIELAFLLPIRFIMYKLRGMQYYLADICYFVNFLELLYIWVWPASQVLWISVYAFSFGTLCMAVIVWRNSLVLHSVDKTTSTFIHLLPPTTLHTINFRIPEEVKAVRFPAAVKVESWATLRSIAITTVFYWIWQIAYQYFITFRKKDKIARGRVTSFEFMRKKYAKTKIGKVVNSLPSVLPHLAFAGIQFGFQVVTMLPCPLLYQNETISTFYLVFVFALASYNGATYYIDVFGERFHKELKELQEELDRYDDTVESSDSTGTSPSTFTNKGAIEVKDRAKHRKSD